MWFIFVKELELDKNLKFIVLSSCKIQDLYATYDVP